MVKVIQVFLVIVVVCALFGEGVCSEDRITALPRSKIQCMGSFLCGMLKDEVEKEEKEYPAYYTTHKQNVNSQLEIIFAFSGPDIDTPEKIELSVNHASVNITRLSKNQWTSFTDIPREGCSVYYLNIYQNGGIWLRHPKTGYIITDGVGSCDRRIDTGKEEEKGSIYFSILLYVVLILGCLIL